MEVIKRTISREELISRDESDYGEVNQQYVFINFHLTQTIDDIGLYSDYPFIEKIVSEIDKNKIVQGLRPDYDISAWHKTGDVITTHTDSKLNDLKGYKADNRFKVGFDINKADYVDFRGRAVNGITRITEKTDENTIYVVDAKNDGVVGTEKQTTGLRYVDSNVGTEVSFKAQGLNGTNSSLSAISKEEYLMGIISTPEIKNDVFIDRGQNTVLEHHLRMSEIETLDHLVNYGNGYFNVTK